MRYLFMSGIFLGMLTQIFAAEIYKWVDADGQVHYGSRPPTENAQRMQIRNNAGNVDSGDAPSTEQRVREQQRFVRALEEEQRSERLAKQKQQQDRVKHEQYCYRLRDRLSRYERSRLYVLDEKGNRRIFDDKEYEAAIADLKEKIAAHCQ